MITRIYLDLNHYIKLSKQYHNKDQNNFIKRLLELVRLNKIFFPISSSHIIELNKHFRRKASD